MFNILSRMRVASVLALILLSMFFRLFDYPFAFADEVLGGAMPIILGPTASGFGGGGGSSGSGRGGSTAIVEPSVEFAEPEPTASVPAETGESTPEEPEAIEVMEAVAEPTPDILILPVPSAGAAGGGSGGEGGTGGSGRALEEEGGNGESVPTDQTAPALTEVTPIDPVTSDNTPSYSFGSDEAGTIHYEGACVVGINEENPESGGGWGVNIPIEGGILPMILGYGNPYGVLTDAVAGVHDFTFYPLPNGTYNDCTIMVKDAAGNVSQPLTISPFTVDAPVLAPASVSIAPGPTGADGDGGGNAFSNANANWMSTLIGTVNGEQTYHSPVQLKSETIMTDAERGIKTAPLTTNGTLTIKPWGYSNISLTIFPNTTVEGTLEWNDRIEPPLPQSVSSLIQAEGAELIGREERLMRDQILDIIKAGSTTSSLNFSNSIRFQVPVDAQSGQVMVYFSEDGKVWEEHGLGTVQDGNLAIETNHLSYFAITKKPAKQPSVMRPLNKAKVHRRDSVRREAHVPTVPRKETALVIAKNPIHRFLFKDRKGKDVAVLQTLLHEQGFYEGRISGLYDEKTENAVLAYQKSLGWQGSGSVGPLTLSRINALIAPAPTSLVAMSRETTPKPAPQTSWLPELKRWVRKVFVGLMSGLA